MVVISGATGYLGRPLAESLVERGTPVRAIVRAGSAVKLPRGVEAVTADPLDGGTFAAFIPRDATFVHLAGTPRPAPWKGLEFRAVDLPAALASIDAARAAGAGHFVYVSVAHPAPIMRAYVEVRRTCEQALVSSGVRHTILRPWYVLGPGHWWPYALAPFYGLAERVPTWRESARRLGLVTHRQMVEALLRAVDARPERGRIVGVAEIRAGGR
ncbi:MAG: NAD(P)H-binding protein [Bryobacteraceae bacterium]